MQYVHPLTFEPETRPKRLRRKGLIGFAPLVMMVWFAYWIGIVSQVCCQPWLADAHHSHMGGHDAHHDGMSADGPAAPVEHENCHQLRNVELVPALAEPLADSVPDMVLIAWLPVFTPFPAIFSTPSSSIRYQQSHPPPNRYLRTRRLLI